MVCLLKGDGMRNVKRECVCKDTGLGYLFVCYTQVVHVCSRKVPLVLASTEVLQLLIK